MTASKQTYECPRCSGIGTIRAFSNVLSGVCFKCGGSGKASHRPSKKVVKPLTKYQAKLYDMICNGDMASYDYRTLKTLRDCAHYQMAAAPMMYEIWMARGEPYLQAARENRLSM